MKPLISIVVPFFNEEENVSLLGLSIAEALREDYDYECVFVNDGSTDGTRAALDALSASDSRIRVLHFKENCGQSAALLAGMRHSHGEYIITLDGDLQNDPCDIPKVVELLKEYDCVCGVRVNRQDSWLRKVSSRVANTVRNAILHDGIQDTGCGTKGFRRRCIEHIVLFNGVHRFFAVLVRNGGFTIAECDVTHHPRLHGTSKYGVGNRLWRGIYDLFGVAWLRRRHVVYELDASEEVTDTSNPHE